MMLQVELADEQSNAIEMGCAICGRREGGRATHSLSYSGNLVLTWAAMPLCDDCAGRLAAGDVDLGQLARKARLLLGGYGFSAN